MVPINPNVKGSLCQKEDRQIWETKICCQHNQQWLSGFFKRRINTRIGKRKETLYLLWRHMSKLILWAFKCKEWTNDKSTTNGKTDSKFLRHQHHDRKKHGECDKDEEHSRCKEHTKVHERFPRRNIASGWLKVARQISHSFWYPEQKLGHMKYSRITTTQASRSGRKMIYQSHSRNDGQNMSQIVSNFSSKFLICSLVEGKRTNH